MAAKDSQGLQIVVIVLSIFTLIFLVGTFLGFRSASQAHADAEAAKSDASQARQAVSTQQAELEEMRAMIGVGDSAGVTIDETKNPFFAEDVQKFGAALAEDKRNYRGMMEALSSENASLNGQILTKDQSIRELTASLAQEQIEKDTTVKQNSALLSQYAATLKAEQLKFTSLKKEVDKEKADLLTKWQAAKDKLTEQETAFNKSQKSSADKLGAMTARFEVVSEEVNRTKPDNFDVPDGTVAWVSARNKTVWINVGSADSLPRQATFSIFDKGSRNSAQAERKGSIQVIRILGAHLSEARITDEEISNPVMPGDEIYTATWHPGRSERFAVTTWIDLDSDGESDLDKVLDLIRLNGGKIDSIVNDQGESPRGFELDKMSINTRYIVVGEPVSLDEPNAGKILAARTQMINRARSMGIKAISVQEFLDYIGYQGEERTEVLNTQSGDQKFTPRRPPSAGVGAY